MSQAAVGQRSAQSPAVNAEVLVLHHHAARLRKILGNQEILRGVLGWRQETGPEVVFVPRSP